VALQVLAQVPVLWIWDNVEPVAGFPKGTESAWSAEEQEDLLDFLLALRGTKAKVLLTSRRAEQSWLGDLPTRIAVPPMPMTESLQLVRALAAKNSRRLADIQDWRPLLAFAEGNPMTLTVVAREALRQGWKTKEQIEAFVARLRSGEVAFPDEAGEGRSRSLGASLAYGFEEAFDEEERKTLALLHLFQGFVNVEVLVLMGHSEYSWCLPEVNGLTREEGRDLLDRAADVGLLRGYRGGCYGIHPALPWFFKGLFEQSYPDGDLSASRAFAEVMGELGDFYFREYEHGNRAVLILLRPEEANFLYVRKISRAHGWWPPLLRIMQGLLQLYSHSGRWAEWKRLVEEIVPDCIDLRNEGPLPGREEDWALVMSYRTKLAIEERRWSEAERLQTIRIDWDRQRAFPALARFKVAPDDGDRHEIRALAVSLERLGLIYRELEQADCVSALGEALELAELIDDRAEAASCALQIGDAFLDMPALHDLDLAAYWYRRSLELAAEQDRLGRGRCVGNLGNVAYMLFCRAHIAGKPNEELSRHFNEAVRLCQEALEVLPVDAVKDLAVAHYRLGNIYGSVGNAKRAMQHYRQAAHLHEQSGDHYMTAQTQFNVARVLLNAGRQVDASEYAEAALRGYESYGERAAAEIEKARGLIAEIRGA